MNTKQTRLILVRHCQSMGNLLKVFQGQTDFDISPLGEQQLELLALRLRNVPIDVLYSSPLLRAWKTAEAINQFHHLDIIKMDELKEIDIGDLAGRGPGKVFEGYPELKEQWANARHKVQFPGGESAKDVWNRAQAARTKILTENAGKTVVAVAHGFLLENMLCFFQYGDFEALPHCHVGGNTSVSEFLISEDGVEIVRVNDSSHLPDELRDRLDFKKI